MFTTDDRERIGGTAQQFGIDERAMIALGLTESNGRVYWEVDGQNQPAIRPEVHVFYRELSSKPTVQKRAVELGLAHPKADGVKLPRSYAGRYEFLKRMMELDEAAAVASTSFGWGQVMGFNFKMLGLGTPLDVMKMASTLEGQTELVARYIEATGLTPFLNNLPSQSSAERVALRYNGPKWRKNNYANKLILNWKNAGAGVDVPIGRSVADLQSALKELGYKPGAIDGQMGPATRAAVRAFQRDNGLATDADAGPLTWEEIDKDLDELQTEAKQRTKDQVGAVGVGVGAIAILSELLGEVSGLRVMFFELFEGFTIPDGVFQIITALLVAYVTYTRFFKK